MKRVGSLRRHLVIYVAGLHLLLAVAAYSAWSARPWVLGLAEVGLVGSLVLGLSLLSVVDRHRRVIAEGRALLRDEEFGTRLREVGFAEIDELVQLFNATTSRLREERVRQREQQAFLERLVEASPTAVLLLDLDQHIASINPAGRDLLGAEAAVDGKALADLPEPFGASLAALADGNTVLIAAGVRRFKATRARFWDRGFARSFLLVEELTEELRRTEREAWGRLVRTISHEVNNSAGAVASLLESCREEVAETVGSPTLEAALTAGARRIRALERFVAGYAEVVRLPAPDRRPVELETLLEELMTVSRPEFDRVAVELRWGQCDGPVWIEADPNQIERVIVNVLRNAAEAIGREGTVLVELRERSGTVEVAIIDDGSGIDPQTLAQLFTPFFSTKSDGRGLGLTLVREILAGHHFEFALEPAAAAPKTGTRFVFWAPSSSADSSGSALSPSRARRAATTPRPAS